jgi:hypothetical protein
MKEIYRIWRMTRFLYKKRFFLAEPGEHEESLIKSGMPESIAKLIPAIGNTSEVRVHKAKAVSFFVNDYFSKYKKTGQGILLNQNPYYSEHFRVANSILNSCIKKKFIYEDKVKKELVYISTAGRIFAGIDGLLIEEIKLTNPLFSVGLGAILGWGASQIPALFGWLTHIIRLIQH